MTSGQNQIYWKQAGSGAPLLLIHGLLVNGDMFMPVFDTFAQSYHVLAPDLRGHGRSGQLAPPYSVEQHAHDLALLLAALSIAPVHVLGYSQGGAVAQQLALAYPHLVRSLILTATFAYNQISGREKLEALLTPWLIKLLTTRHFARLIARMMGNVTPEQSALLEQMLTANTKQQMLAAVAGMVNFDSRARLGEIQMPTLIVAGANDTAVPIYHAQMLANGITGAKLHVIPNAGHELIFTHGTALVNAVQDFLQENSAPSEPAGMPKSILDVPMQGTFLCTK